jgi:hypothetical protein
MQQFQGRFGINIFRKTTRAEDYYNAKLITISMEIVTIGLLIMGGIILIWLGYKLGSIVKEQEWIEKLPKLREESVKKSREVLTGNFSEQLAPYLPGFPFSPTECKFLGKPVDFIVFKGLDRGNTEEIVFVEVKTGNSELSKSEKVIQDTVNKKKISWYEYRR